MRWDRSRCVALVVVAALITVAAMASPSVAQFDPPRYRDVLQGNVVWSGRAPANAILQVFLFDLTNPAFPTIIADQAINNPVGSPTPFQLTFDPRRIIAGRTYGMQARIIHGNPPQVAYTNRETPYVLTRDGQRAVTIRLEPTGSIVGDAGNIVQGNVVWSGLPPAGAILQVFLLDLTNPAYPVIIADQAINNPVDSPTPFQLTFDLRRIIAGRTYGMQARIIHGNPPQVAYTNRETPYVLTRDGQRAVTIRLEPTGSIVGDAGNVVQGNVVWSGTPPAGAILQIFLFDLTDPGFPEIIVDQAISNPVGSSTPFQLRFDPRRIAVGRRYGVQARMIYGNPPQVLYISPQAAYVLTTRDYPNNVTIRLQRTESFGSDGGFDPAPPGERRFGRGSISGSVSFPAGKIPANAILQVFLFDLTDRAAPQIVADQAINIAGRGKAVYNLRFDPRRIDPSHLYGVQARIIHGVPPVVLLTSGPRTAYVLTRGRPDSADLKLRRPRD